MNVNLILSIVFLTLSVVLTDIYCRLAQGTRLMDKPNDRSMHIAPTSRGGGLVFVSLGLLAIPILCALTHTSFLGQLILIVSALIIAAISFVDDLYHLSAKLRFLVQSLVALLFVVFMRPQQLDLVLFSINYSLLIIPVVFLLVLWAINHFNFMDGIDGFCASQAIFLFAAYSVLFAIYGATYYQYFCIVMVSCLFGFLLFNFPPAKLFMGDVGSATLGLLTFAMALIAQQKLQIPILYWFMLNGLFLFDATSTLIRRILKKENWSAPHKKHAYQRLRQAGISVPIILLGQLVINSSFLVLVLLMNNQVFYSILLIGAQVGLVFVIYHLIEKIFPMFQAEFTS
jgi:UDP-N-acetylmuramyl pentapeptide phosphotransferase/UDP-N-acetylglucosamine-1-phosphate transferase